MPLGTPLVRTVVAMIVCAGMISAQTALGDESPNAEGERLIAAAYHRYPTHMSINVIRIRDSYLGQIYLTNFFANLAKSDPDISAFEELFFRGVDTVHLVTEIPETKVGQAAQPVPPAMMFFRGRIDRARWKRMISATRPAIVVGTTEIYRTSLGGDLRQDQNPLAPIFTKDEDVFVGFVNPQLALLSWGIPEAKLRELLSARAAEGDADSKVALQTDRDALRQHMLVAKGPLPLPDDGAVSTPVRMTLAVDLTEEMRIDWQFECKTIRHAAQIEETAKASIDQGKTMARLMFSALGHRGKLFDELVAHIHLKRDSRFLQFSLHAPMALLHMWVNDNPDGLAYVDADGEEVKRREEAKYVLLDCITEGRAADDLFPMLADQQFGGTYYRKRSECFGIDGSRQPFPGKTNQTAIIMMAVWTPDPTSSKLRIAGYERRGPDNKPACDATGTSKQVLVCDFGAGGEPSDAVYFDGQGNRCAVRVVVNEVLPDSQAARVGLKTGDQLVSIGGIAVTSVEKLRHVLSQPAPQSENTDPTELTLVVLREMVEKKFVVQRKLLGAMLSVSAIRSE